MIYVWEWYIGWDECGEHTPSIRLRKYWFEFVAGNSKISDQPGNTYADKGERVVMLNWYDWREGVIASFMCQSRFPGWMHRLKIQGKLSLQMKVNVWQIQCFRNLEKMDRRFRWAVSGLRRNQASKRAREPALENIALASSAVEISWYFTLGQWVLCKDDHLSTDEDNSATNLLHQSLKISGRIPGCPTWQ